MELLPFFHQICKILILFVLQKCAECQDLPTLQFWSKSHYPFWTYFPFFIKILILFVLYYKNYKRQMVSWNCKHIQHVKIYPPCNFEENLITYLGVIALFSSILFLILILFVLYFKNYLEIDVKFKLQKICSMSRSTCTYPAILK